MISLEASHFLTNGYEVTEQMARISMPTTTLERFAEAQSQMMSLVWSSELSMMRALGTSFLVFVGWYLVKKSLHGTNLAQSSTYNFKIAHEVVVEF